MNQVSTVSPVAPKTTLSEIKRFAELRLLLAQKEFTKSPNAVNWNVTIAAMLVHQQVTYPGLMFIESALDILCHELDKTQQCFWPETIVQHITGRSIAQCLKEAA